MTPADLRQFTGTEQWYRSALNRGVVYTDGVRYFAENAGAYWLLDILATELPPHVRREGFLGVKMHVADNQAIVTADDGNGREVWCRKIEFTDCPDGVWSFFMAPGGPSNTLVIMVPSEY